MPFHTQPPTRPRIRCLSAPLDVFMFLFTFPFVVNLKVAHRRFPSAPSPVSQSPPFSCPSWRQSSHCGPRLPVCDKVSQTFYSSSPLMCSPLARQPRHLDTSRSGHCTNIASLHFISGPAVQLIFAHPYSHLFVLTLLTSTFGLTSVLVCNENSKSLSTPLVATQTSDVLLGIQL